MESLYHAGNGQSEGDGKSSAAGDGTAPPNPDEVRNAVGRVVNSEAFRASPQLAAFLTFVVEAELRGESKRIKGYTIAVEALGRAHSFDPQTDSIVRVVAGRLRRVLERYYAEAGADEGVVIELPRGRYIPIFRRRSVGAAAEGALASLENAGVVRAAPDASPKPRWPMVRMVRRRVAKLGFVPALVIGMAVIAATGLTLLGMRGADISKAVDSAGDAAPGASRHIRPLPVVLIEPFEEVGKPSAAAFAVGPLRAKIGDAMARFDAINVITDRALAASADKPANWSHYVLAGSAEYHADGATTLSFRLVDASDGALIWSRMFPRLPTSDAAAAEEAIVREVATSIADPFGIVWRLELASRRVRDARTACLANANEYWHSFDPAQHEPMRQCLERLVAQEPSLPAGYLGLTLIYYRDFLMGIAPPGQPPALDRALQAAKRAVELRPYSARAQDAIAMIWFARGETALATAAGDRALVLNPYDTNVIADYGARLIAAGELDRGIAMLDDAAAYSQVGTTLFQFYRFLGAYLKGDQTIASRHASLIMSNASPYGLLARALTANSAGERDNAKSAIDGLIALSPTWRSEPRRQLARFFPSAEIQDRLLHDLTAAGLGATD
jgi:TolB-like protein